MAEVPDYAKARFLHKSCPSFQRHTKDPASNEVERGRRTRPCRHRRQKIKGELTREHYRTMIFYGFKMGLNPYECVEWLQQAFGDESPCRAPVFRLFKKFCRGRNSLQYKHTQEGCGR
ncbi:histone-lysine N-methyltransferase SETMAR [Trichonephila clavipes]|nr:histone-lysine N-methyltransferase SETMAR [Trichonephila clavipes]